MPSPLIAAEFIFGPQLKKKRKKSLVFVFPSAAGKEEEKETQLTVWRLESSVKGNMMHPGNKQLFSFKP